MQQRGQEGAGEVCPAGRCGTWIKDWLTLCGASLKSAGQTGTPGGRNAESPRPPPRPPHLGPSPDRRGPPHHGGSLSPKSLIIHVTQSTEAFGAHGLGL